MDRIRRGFDGSNIDNNGSKFKMTSAQRIQFRAGYMDALDDKKENRQKDLELLAKVKSSQYINGYKRGIGK